MRLINDDNRFWLFFVSLFFIGGSRGGRLRSAIFRASERDFSRFGARFFALLFGLEVEWQPGFFSHLARRSRTWRAEGVSELGLVAIAATSAGDTQISGALKTIH